MKQTSVLHAAFTAVSVAFFASSLQADDITTLFNTGVDASGVALADDTPDPHWTLVDPSPQVGSPLVVASAGGFPVPPWLGDSAESAWAGTLNPTALGPGSNGNAGEYADYHYQTTFSLAGLDPTSAVLEGRASFDNFLQDVLVNGQSTGISYPASDPGAGFGGWNEFAFDANAIGLLNGDENTVTFIVRSAQADGADDYTSLRVEWTTATANAIPEPATMSTLLIGFCGLMAARRRR